MTKISWSRAVARGGCPLTYLLTGLVVATLLIVAGSGAALAQTFRFNSVAVEGNLRVDTATVLSFADIERGQTLSAAELNDAAQRIRNSGLFETVSVDPRGNVLVITVQEWPTINRISIEGNRRIDDEQFMPLLQSLPRRVYSPTIAEQDAALILSAYEAQGRLAATVTPRIIRRSENRVDLVFEVTEGRPVEIERLSFVGNRAYSDRRLRRVLETKQAGLLRQLIGRDTFVADRIAFDRQVLTDFYQSRGYVDFQILDVTTELARERNATFITITVQEGQTFDFGEITTVSDLPEIDADEFQAAIRIRPGQTYTPLAVETTITRLERLALEKKLDFIRVEPRITRDDRNLELDIEFAVTRGPRVFVERIDIEGNATTLDRVIRRQFDTVEGDPFNPRAIRDAAERIRALGFFANADVEAREGTTPDQVIVDVDVEEQPTGSLSFGGSFSDEDGFGIALGFSENNFLGRGQALSFDIQTTDANSNSQITFVEPAFLGRDLRFEFRAFYQTSNFDNTDYDTRVVGVSPAIAFPVGENSRLRFSLSVSEDTILNVDPGSSPIILAEAGGLITNSVSYTYTFDNRRSGLNPTAGVLLSFGQEFAGLGGDSEFVRTTARAIAQRRVLNEEVTLRASLEGGAINSLGGNVTRVTDRFFTSTNQLRGFASRGVGPRDLAAANQDVLGGNFYSVARFEAEFPLGLPEEYGISGGVFFDAGSVWGLDNTNGAGGPNSVDDGFELRTAIGFSIFWTTPIGPLRLNFSRPLDKNAFDEENTFNFTVSTQF